MAAGEFRPRNGQSIAQVEDQSLHACRVNDIRARKYGDDLGGQQLPPVLKPLANLQLG